MKYKTSMHGIIACLLALMILTGYSCQKQAPLSPQPQVSDAVKKFITAPIDATPILQEVTSVINREEALRPFLEGIIKSQGMVHWQYAKVATTFTGDTLITAPLIKDSQRIVHSVLMVIKRQNHFRFTIINGDDYAKYGFSKGIQTFNASFAALQLIDFQHRVFGDSLFAVNDSRLFGGSRYLRYKSHPALQTRNRLVTIILENCETVVHEGNQGQVVGTGPGETPDYPHEETVCITTTIFIETGGGGGGGTPSPGDGWVPGANTGTGNGLGGAWYPQTPGDGPFYPPMPPCPNCTPLTPEEPEILRPDLGPVIPITVDHNYQVTAPKHPVDITAETNCFTSDPDAVYKISLNINQPIPNARDLINVSADHIVGHAFLTLQQINSPTDTKVRNVGFYPKTVAKPGSESDESIFSDDSETPTCVTLTVTVSAAEFQTVLNFLRNATAMPYHLAFNNCTVVALDALAKIGIELPRTFGNAMLFSGLNPGDLGQDIRGLNLLSLSQASNGKVFVRTTSNINVVSVPPRQGK